MRDARLAATLLAAPRAEWVECYRALLPPLEELTHLGEALPPGNLPTQFMPPGILAH